MYNSYSQYARPDSARFARGRNSPVARKFNFTFGHKSLVLLLVLIAVLLSLLYLAHFNQVATKGYDVKRLEATRNELLNEYQINNRTLADVKSLNNIAQSEKVNRMRPIYEVVFVKDGNTAIASK